MRLITGNIDKLKDSSDPFNFETGVATPSGKTLTAVELYEILKETMCKHRGLGVSACQIGIMTRVFVIGNPDEPDEVLPVFNPTLVNMSVETEVYEEGCLSFPGMYIKIKRPQILRARFTDQFGNTDTKQFSGLTARVFQHEYDHLDGIVFTRRANTFHLDQAKRQMKKIIKLRKSNENIPREIG